MSSKGRIHSASEPGISIVKRADILPDNFFISGYFNDNDGGDDGGDDDDETTTMTMMMTTMTMAMVIS